MIESAQSFALLARRIVASAGVRRFEQPAAVDLVAVELSPGGTHAAEGPQTDDQGGQRGDNAGGEDCAEVGGDFVRGHGSELLVVASAGEVVSTATRREECEGDGRGDDAGERVEGG